MRAWFEQLPTEARWVIGAALGGFVILLMAFLIKCPHPFWRVCSKAVAMNLECTHVGL